MYTGVEDPAGGHCGADRPQHLAWRVGSDDLEGMVAVGMTPSTCIHQDFSYAKQKPNSLASIQREFIGSSKWEDPRLTGFRRV